MEQIHLISLIFIIVFLLQAYYYLRYFLAFVFAKNQKNTYSSNIIPVSVIICAHNEIRNLQHNLPKFLDQDHENFEVILVNDRSNDNSKQWLESIKSIYPQLKLIHISETPTGFNSKKYALTKGIQASANEIILLSDADCEPASRHWVDRMSQYFNNSISIVLGASLYKKRTGLLNEFIRFETLQTALLYLSFAFKSEPYMGVGRNLAYKKSHFMKTDGFANLKAVMGGDDDLWVNSNATKENTTICTSPESLTFSSPKETWSEFFKQKKRHLSVGKYYKTKDKIKLGFFHFTQSALWISFILGCMLGNPSDCLILSFLFLTYIIGQYVVFYKLSIKFGIKFSHKKLPILEILFIGYYWTWGIYATLTKHLTWK